MYILNMICKRIFFSDMSCGGDERFQWVEFELAYFAATVQHFSPCATMNTPNIYREIFEDLISMSYIMALQPLQSSQSRSLDVWWTTEVNSPLRLQQGRKKFAFWVLSRYISSVLQSRPDILIPSIKRRFRNSGRWLVWFVSGIK